MWEHIDYPERVMILYDGQVPVPESPTLNQKWRVYYSFLGINPLVQPYPQGTQLFRARHSSKYPYELIDIVPLQDVYNTDQPGTYFVAFTGPYDGTSRIPFSQKYIFVKDGARVI